MLGNKLHIVGIGGIGMSGLAKILHSQGYSVKGSDSKENGNIASLRELGIDVYIGQSSSNLQEVDTVIRSSAIKDDNSEIVHAFEKGIPVLSRSECLSMILGKNPSIQISGTHGKTTTTSLIGFITDFCGKPVTIINGGIMNNYNSNVYIGVGDLMVVEADESDGTFINISPASIAVLTSINYNEHIDFYSSTENMKNCFYDFVSRSGKIVANLDDPQISNLVSQLECKDNVFGYGMHVNKGPCMSKIVNISTEDFITSFSVEFNNSSKLDFKINLPGLHNVYNATAAISVSLINGFSYDQIYRALLEYKGVQRRFTRVGFLNGALIIDDYAHHPEEILTTLKAARNIANRVIAVLQPHRFSRLCNMFDDYVDVGNFADIMFVTEVFPAGENPINGIDSSSLVNAINKKGNKQVFLVAKKDLLLDKLSEILNPDDIVVFMGAGDITNWAHYCVS